MWGSVLAKVLSPCRASRHSILLEHLNLRVCKWTKYASARILFTGFAEHFGWNRHKWLVFFWMFEYRLLASFFHQSIHSTLWHASTYSRAASSKSFWMLYILGTVRFSRPTSIASWSKARTTCWACFTPILMAWHSWGCIIFSAKTSSITAFQEPTRQSRFKFTKHYDRGDVVIVTNLRITYLLYYVLLQSPRDLGNFGKAPCGMGSPQTHPPPNLYELLLHQPKPQRESSKKRGFYMIVVL